MTEDKPRRVSIVRLEPAILRREEAAAYMGIGTALLERLAAKGKLPKPRQISDGCAGWLRTELDAAAHALPVSTLAPGPGRKATV